MRDVDGWKLHVQRGFQKVKELYHLQNDIDESDNIYSQYPYVVQRLQKAAEAFDQEVAANQRPSGDAG